MENYQPKISTPEAMLLIAWAGLIDIIGLILVIFLLDDFFILDMLGMPTQLYLRMKKVNGAGYDLAASLGEFIPYVGALPLKTAGILTVIWVDRHPAGAIAKTTSIAAKAVPAIKKQTVVSAPKTLEGITT